MDFPTTPIKPNATNEIHQLSVVQSPPILKSDTEQNIGETSDEPLSHLEGYPHGISAKKKVAAQEVRETVNSNNDQTDDCDMSIELGRNNSDFKSDTDGFSNSDLSPNNKVNLDNSDNEIEINSNNKGDTSSDDPFQNKHKIEDNEENASSSKKIKLNNVPDLHQEDGSKLNNDKGEPTELNSNPQPTESISPIRIQMIDDNQFHSPKPHYERNENGNNESDHEILDEPFDNSNKLTPIAHQPISSYEDFDINIDIDSISKRNDELNDQIFSLNQRINSMHVVNDKLKVEIKQLQFNNNMIKEEKTKLQEQIDIHHNELKQENENIMKDLEDVKSELSSLQSNKTLVQEKYDQIYNENIKLQNAKDMLSNEVETLQKSLSDSADILEDLTANNKDLEAKLNQTSASKHSIENERNELNKELRRIMAQLDGKDNEITTLEDKIKGLIESERNHSRDLIDQVASLNNDKMNLEETLKKSENSHKTEVQYLQDTIDEKEKQLVELKEQNAQIGKDKAAVEDKLKQITNELETLKKTYEETSGNATTRTAEVTELNNKVVSLEGLKSNLELNISRLEDMMQEWKSKYQQEVEEKQKIHTKLELLQETKNENDKTNSVSLQEYQLIKEENERLIARLENQSNSSDASNSVVQKYKEQIEALKRKSDQREGDFNKRLKKLSEDLYIQYSSKHEQKVAALKTSYDDRYESKFERLKNENNALQQEVEQLNGKLSLERREKQELIKALGD